MTTTQTQPEQWVAELDAEIGRLELRLATLSGVFDEGLPSAVVGAMGLSVAELRQQLPALRQAARDWSGE